MTDIVQRNGLASETDEKYADYQDNPTPERTAALIELVPALAAEIDEAQRWAITGRNHREAIQQRLTEARAKVDELTAERDLNGDLLDGAARALGIDLEDPDVHYAFNIPTKVAELVADLTQSRAQAATYANEIGTLKAELEHLREQVFAQKPVVEAAQAWAETVEIGGDAPGDARKVEDALHDAIEQHRLMDMALTSARAEQPAVTR